MERYFAGETTAAEERELREAAAGRLAAGEAKTAEPTGATEMAEAADAETALLAGLQALSEERCPGMRLSGDMLSGERISDDTLSGKQISDDPLSDDPLSGERLSGGRLSGRDARPAAVPGRVVILRRLRITAVAAAAIVGIFLAAHRIGTPYCYVDGRAIRDCDEALAALSGLECLDGLNEFGRQVDLFDELMNMNN